MFFSENLRGVLEANPQVEITGEPEAMAFDADGNLLNELSIEHEMASAH